MSSLPETTPSCIPFQEIWHKLSCDQRAGFLVWPSLAGTQLTSGESLLLEQYAPWGLTFFGRNLKTLSRSAALCREVRETLARTRPPGCSNLGFLAIDEEGGRVSRLPAPFPKLSAAASLAQKNEDEIRSQALLQATVARGLGINMFFAPVCDVLTEPTNAVIGDRSFGGDPDVVFAKARLIFEELLDQRICPVIKHFPGHGGTKEDTHLVSARVSGSVQEMLKNELQVFQSFFLHYKPKAIMTCHVVFDSLDSSWPVTLSSKILHDLLRVKMGFQGLVISDDLRMNAIAECFGVQKNQEAAIGSDELARIESSHQKIDQKVLPTALQSQIQSDDHYLGSATIRALEAGCDVVLACRSIEREVVCLDAVAQKIRNDVAFDQICQEKAKRVFELARLYP